MAPLLAMQGIVKEFPGVRALDGVDLHVEAGEVHCLLGQNGAGKSTLIKVIAGAHQPEEGTITWAGEEVTLPTPIAAIRRGIATMYQELDLVPGLTVAENVWLGHEMTTAKFPRRGSETSATKALLKRLGHSEIPVGREVGKLSAAQQQLVSMARALSHDAKLIVMDEPSAVLDQDEVENLFRVVRELSSQGVAIVYISHRLEEIRQIGDRITVIKDGRTVAVDLPAKTTSTNDVVRLMTGRNIEYAFPVRQTGQPLAERATLLEVSGISRPGEFSDVSLTVRAGEIVGLAGLVGSGRSEILETIYGARRPAAGTVVLDGRKLPGGSVEAAVRAGMGLAPEERKSQALFLDHPVAHNISAASMGKYSRFGWIARHRELADADAQAKALELRPTGSMRPVRNLSGGNQQKAVVGRWLLKGCRLLILDEPTRGVDIGARAELYALIRDLADSGVGVLMVSSEIPEVLGLADTVLVVREGRIVRQASSGELDEHAVLDLVMSGSAEGALA